MSLKYEPTRAWVRQARSVTINWRGFDHQVRESGEQLEIFHLKAKARTGPRLSCVCRVCSTAAGVHRGETRAAAFVSARPTVLTFDARCVDFDARCVDFEPIMLTLMLIVLTFAGAEEDGLDGCASRQRFTPVRTSTSPWSGTKSSLSRFLIWTASRRIPASSSSRAFSTNLTPIYV